MYFCTVFWCGGNTFPFSNNMMRASSQNSFSHSVSGASEGPGDLDRTRIPIPQARDWGSGKPLSHGTGQWAGLCLQSLSPFPSTEAPRYLPRHTVHDLTFFNKALSIAQAFAVTSPVFIKHNPGLEFVTRRAVCAEKRLCQVWGVGNIRTEKAGL